MTELRFRVGVDVVVGGRLHLFAEKSDVRGVGSMLCEGEDPAKPPALFFVSAWIGGKSKAVCVQELGKDRTADLVLPLRDGDVDTVKISITFNMHELTNTPRAPRNYHLATTYIETSSLLSMLSEAQSGKVGASSQCVCLQDNFTKNGAVLRIANLGTNIPALRALRLTASALKSTDRINEAVGRLGKRILAHVSRCEVSPLNAGSQYTSGYTYLPMEKQLSHYSILGMTFDQLETPVDLTLTMYNAYQAVQSTGISLKGLASMPPHELVLRFGNVLITQTMSCERTAPYSSDLTFNRLGQVVKETEHMRRTMSSVAMLTQRVKDRYVRGGGCADMPLQSVVDALAFVTADHEPRVRPGLGMCACNDDCENLYQYGLMNAKGLLSVFVTLLKTGAHPSTYARTLTVAMIAAAARHPQFSKIQAGHHAAMAPLLITLGGLLHSGDWNVELGVVSAKGPAFDANNPNPDQLSGHAAGISRVRCGDRFVHLPVEGTSYIRVVPPVPSGYAAKIGVVLADGSSQDFPVHDLSTVISQNCHEVAGISMDHRILGHMCSRLDCDPSDIMLKSSFYVSAFYSSLREGEGTLGCIPVDTNPPRQVAAKGKPLFGAPVMGLSMPTTMAVPVVPGMLAVDESDTKEAEELCALLRQQASEVWSPEASQETMHTLLSYWEPLEAPEGEHLRDDFQIFTKCENTWSFDSPEHTAMATRLYKELARRFNVLQVFPSRVRAHCPPCLTVFSRVQSKEPKGDGITATAYGKYRSAALSLHMPLPRCGVPFQLTCMRNIRRVVQELGMQPLVNHSGKMAHVGARAAIPSTHHMYVSAESGGLVHSHRVKLA